MLKRLIKENVVMKKQLAIFLPAILLATLGTSVIASEPLLLKPSPKGVSSFYTPRVCPTCKPPKVKTPMEFLFVHDDMDDTKRQLFGIKKGDGKALFYKLSYNDGRFFLTSNMLTSGSAKTFEMTEEYLFVVRKKGGGIVMHHFLDNYAARSSNRVTLKQYRVNNLEPQENFLFLATEENGLIIADIRDRDDILIAGKYAASTPLLDVDVLGEHAYILVEGKGMEVLDLSDRQNPKKVGAFASIEGEMKKIDVYNGMAFILTPQKVYIVDVTDTSKMTLRAIYKPKKGELKAMKRSGETMFVVATGGIQVIDISKQKALNIVGEVPLPEGKDACDIAFNNKAGSAYVALCDAPFMHYVMTDAYKKSYAQNKVSK